MAEKKPEKYKLKEVRIRLAKGRALYSEKPLSSPAAALDVMRREMSQYDREVLCVVNMNSRLQPINFNIVSVRDINTSIAAIPNIMKSGLMTNTGSFLLLHNHPSGDVTPSKDDILTTRKVIEAGKLMGIPFTKLDADLIDLCCLFCPIFLFHFSDLLLSCLCPVKRPIELHVAGLPHAQMQPALPAGHNDVVHTKDPDELPRLDDPLRHGDVLLSEEYYTKQKK